MTPYEWAAVIYGAWLLLAFPIGIGIGKLLHRMDRRRK
jgi:hypothetical protein